MAEVKYSFDAINDLDEIGDYISRTLHSPLAAFNTTNNIRISISLLSEFPFSGAPLSSIVGIDTDIRFLVCGNYLIFYLVEDNVVTIGRILYGKRNYLSILFSNLPKTQKA